MKIGAELSIFCFYLITSLFLGDGKQPFVDVWWALGILMMYGARYYQRGKLDLRPLPRPINLAWTGLILYYIILTQFSDSVGYSITATIRLIEAYLVYVMFMTITSERAITLFVKGLLFTGVIATLASFMFLLVPSWASFLPPMNLLYATYGHNHLADLLLMIFPLLIVQLQHKQSKSSWFLLIFFATGMLLTFARGAWLLLTLYLLFFVVRSKNTTTRKIGLSIAAATIVVFLLVSLVSLRDSPSGASLRGAPQNNGFISRLARQVQKPSLLADGRWEYWRQAVTAIKERPSFGSGPGTFYLQSKRLQSAPSSYSWFAHSFPLETMVEVGVVGVILLSLVLIASLRRARGSPLFVPLCLILLYSFFEFNLNYAVVWLLLWAILGLSFNDKKNNHQRHQGSHRVMIGGLLVLCIFYVTYISSVALDVVGKKKLSFYIAPYIASTTKNYLEQINRDNQKFTPIEERFITKLYKKDPDVLILLAQHELVKELDPQNEEYQKKRMEFYLRNKEYGLFFEEYKSILLRKLNYKTRGLLDGIIISDQDVAPKNYELLGSQLKTDRYSLDELAKNLFLLGFSLVDAKPHVAKQLFIIARDIAPTWSYFHLALSSYYHYYEDQKELAQDVLKNCLRYEYAGDHCADVMRLSIPTLNEIKDYVLTMP